MDDNDLLTLEIRVKREGVLDRDAALGLIEQVRSLQQAADDSEDHAANEYGRGFDDAEKGRSFCPGGRP